MKRLSTEWRNKIRKLDRLYTESMNLKFEIEKYLKDRGVDKDFIDDCLTSMLVESDSANDFIKFVEEELENLEG